MMGLTNTQIQKITYVIERTSWVPTMKSPDEFIGSKNMKLCCSICLYLFRVVFNKAALNLKKELYNQEKVIQSGL